MANTYDIGNVIRLTGTFRDASGTLVDPTIIQLNVRPYGGEIETFTFEADQVLFLSTGIYYYDYTPLTAAKYFYRFIGGGDVIAAGDNSFDVSASPAVGTWPPPPVC